MAKPSPSVRLVQSDETPTVQQELEAIEGEMLRGMSFLRVLARAVADIGDAELEVSLEPAAEHLDRAHNRMDCAWMRLSQEQ